MTIIETWRPMYVLGSSLDNRNLHGMRTEVAMENVYF